jgi:hypothetical protein
MAESPDSLVESGWDHLGEVRFWWGVVTTGAVDLAAIVLLLWSAWEPLGWALIGMGILCLFLTLLVKAKHDGEVKHLSLTGLLPVASVNERQPRIASQMPPTERETVQPAGIRGEILEAQETGFDGGGYRSTKEHPLGDYDWPLYRYRFNLHIYLFNDGPATSIKDFQFTLFEDAESYRGSTQPLQIKEQHTAEWSISYSEWDATTVTRRVRDLLTVIHAPFEAHAGIDGWLTVIVSGVPRAHGKTTVIRSRRIELKVIDAANVNKTPLVLTR